MNIIEKLIAKYGTENVILPPPPDEEVEKFHIKPEKTNKNLVDLLHKIKIWEDLTLKDKPEDLIAEINKPSEKDKEMVNILNAPSHHDVRLTPEKRTVIPGSMKSKSSDSSDVLKMCEAYCKLACK